MFWIIFSAVYTAFALYFFLRLVYPLPFRWQAKSAIFIFIFIPLMLRFASDETIFSVPDSLLMVPSWLFLSIIVGASLALFADIVRLVLYVCRVRVPWARCLPVILCLAGSIAAYGMYEAVKVPPVTRYTLSFPNLPRALDGKTIGVVADPQITRLFRGAWLQESFEKLMTYKPDMIVIVGDAVDASLHLLQEEAKAFGLLQAPMGVYFIPGNHDYYAGYSEWRRYFRSLPHMTVLENAHKTLPLKNGSDNDTNNSNDALHIIGITDPRAGAFGFEGPNADKALAGLTPAAGENFRLLLGHRPYHREYVKVQAQLLLTGHTHGGVLLPMQDYVASRNDGYVSGLYETDFGSLFVSDGMGIWDGFPMRLGVPSEMPIITLRRGAK